MVQYTFSQFDMHRVKITMNKTEQIKQIKEQHPNWGYGKIAKLVNCAKNTVRYHLDPLQKEVAKKRVIKWRSSAHPLYRKIICFCTDNCPSNRDTRTRKNKYPIFKLDDLLQILGDNPKCYLTGEPINILDKKTYSLDHIIPLCKGGTSTLGNCGLTTRQANMCKNGLLVEEFINFCKQVLLHQGYTVKEPLKASG
jgi:hypothetical protein